jgi:hypothetical protein
MCITITKVTERYVQQIGDDGTWSEPISIYHIESGTNYMKLNMCELIELRRLLDLAIKG